ncbi:MULTISPECIES: DUF3040 domain-containing protein [unclassified Streptomyces]|uniref:DUF3040 domain-containing protein n=1 Tax=unclassified Streptomyces TaxID=2593676 RepID=UPI00100840DD|nr:DUF3040 domain-containing protein [Streptomyces sp. S063]
MAVFDDRPLESLAARTRRDDPAFVRALSTGRPRAPREYRRRPHGRKAAWCVLALALAAFAAGIILPHGLLLASGIVAAGIAGDLFEPPR